MKKFVTRVSDGKYLESTEIVGEEYTTDWEWNIVFVYDTEVKQNWLGMGGAITEAVAHNFYLLNKEMQEEFLNAYFSKNGLNYNWGRISIGSNDFSVASYEYLTRPNLKTFTIEHDKEKIIPLIKRIFEKNTLNLVASPWSPPAFMKENHSLVFGGKLEKKYYSLYAKYLQKFIQEYKKLGIPIQYITMQNEPNATQKWESCVYSLEEQKELLYQYLVKHLQNTKILLWDHNKENLVQVVNFLWKKHKKIAGVAYHWYTGTHSENIALVHQKYPEALLIHTEGCCSFSKFDKKKWLEYAELLLTDMLLDIHNGMNAYIDWNLLLNDKGGPNHVENYCLSPILLDEKRNKLIYTPIFYYFYHIGHFVEPNSQVLAIDFYRLDLIGCAFKKEETVTIVLVNPTDHDMEVNIVLKKKRYQDSIKSHSICTYKE